MKTELKQQLIESIQTGKLRQAVYYTKWYGSYQTCLIVWGYVDGTFTIRKDDINRNGFISRTHHIHSDLTAEQATKMLTKIRENTYHLEHIENYED